MDAERELTGIERAVMQKIIFRVFAELKVAWARALSVDPKSVGFETNPQFIQIVPPGETVIVVSLQLNMPSASGIISLCYPYVTLESQLEKLSTQNWLERSRASESSAEGDVIESFVSDTDVQIEAQLAQQEMSVREILALEPGCVIPLNQRAGSHIEVHVEGLPKFKATVGKTGRRRAVRIEGPVDKQDT